MTGQVPSNDIMFSMRAPVGLLLVLHSQCAIINMCLMTCFRHDDVVYVYLYVGATRSQRP